MQLLLVEISGHELLYRHLHLFNRLSMRSDSVQRAESDLIIENQNLVKLIKVDVLLPLPFQDFIQTTS